MAGVESAKKALWALLRSLKAGRTAKLTVTTAKGKLKVILEESFTQHSNVSASTKSPKRASPSQLALFDISISNIDCRYINTFEKYRYRYGNF